MRELAEEKSMPAPEGNSTEPIEDDHKRGAQMPADRIKPATKSVGELKVGESGYVALLHVRVDREGYVYVEKTAVLEGEPSPLHFELSRQADGYHLDLQGSSFRFRRSEIVSRQRYVPVVEITGNPPE